MCGEVFAGVKSEMEFGWINGINLTVVILLIFGVCHLMIVQENQS